MSDYYVTQDSTDIIIAAIKILARELEHCHNSKQFMKYRFCEMVKEDKNENDWFIELKKDCKGDASCEYCVNNNKRYKVHLTENEDDD